MARARFHRPGLASQSPSILWLSRSARTIAHSHARARRAPCVKLPVTHSAQAIKNTANQHLVRYALHDARGLTDFVVAFAVLRKSCGHAPPNVGHRVATTGAFAYNDQRSESLVILMDVEGK